MRETRDLVRAWRALPEGAPAVLATVVATRGSTYRRAGARMLIAEGGWLAGSISGGCLESDLVHTAWARTEDGPALVEYDATGEDDVALGLGLGCNGATTVLLARLPSDGGVLSLLERGLTSPLTIETDPITGASREVARAEPREGVLVETLAPPPALLIFGAGHDAIPLARLGTDLGWRVTVADARLTHARAERFPGASVLHAPYPDAPIPGGAHVVVMTHSYASDLVLLRRLLPSGAASIGQLGPRARTERLLSELGFAPTEAQLARLRAPVGLDLGAEGPDEIALAIVAEIVALRKGRNGGSLTECSRGELLPLQGKVPEGRMGRSHEADDAH